MSYMYLHARNYCKYLHLLMYFILTPYTFYSWENGHKDSFISPTITPKCDHTQACYFTSEQGAKLLFESMVCSPTYLLDSAASQVLLMPLPHL